MDRKYIYEYSKIKRCIYKVDEEFSSKDLEDIDYKYFYRLDDFDVDNFLQRLYFKLIISSGESRLESRFYLEIYIVSFFTIYDIRYMIDIEEILINEALTREVWFYLESLSLKLDLWGQNNIINSLPPIIKEDLINLEVDHW